MQLARLGALHCAALVAAAGAATAPAAAAPLHASSPASAVNTGERLEGRVQLRALLRSPTCRNLADGLGPLPLQQQEASQRRLLGRSSLAPRGGGPHRALPPLQEHSSAPALNPSTHGNWCATTPQVCEPPWELLAGGCLLQHPHVQPPRLGPSAHQYQLRQDAVDLPQLPSRESPLHPMLPLGADKGLLAFASHMRRLGQEGITVAFKVAIGCRNNQYPATAPRWQLPWRRGRALGVTVLPSQCCPEFTPLLASQRTLDLSEIAMWSLHWRVQDTTA